MPRGLELPTQKISVSGGFARRRFEGLGKPLRPGNSGASSMALGIFSHSLSIRRRVAASSWSSKSVRECSTTCHCYMLRKKTADVARGALHEIGGRVRPGLGSSIAMALAAQLLAAQLFTKRVDWSLLVDGSSSPGLSIELTCPSAGL